MQRLDDVTRYHRWSQWQAVKKCLFFVFLMCLKSSPVCIKHHKACGLSVWHSCHPGMCSFVSNDEWHIANSKWLFLYNTCLKKTALIAGDHEIYQSLVQCVNSSPVCWHYLYGPKTKDNHATFWLNTHFWKCKVHHSSCVTMRSNVQPALLYDTMIRAQVGDVGENHNWIRPGGTLL